MGEPAIQIVTLSFFRFDTLSARLWAFAMMGLAGNHDAHAGSGVLEALRIGNRRRVYAKAEHPRLCHPMCLA